MARFKHSGRNLAGAALLIALALAAPPGAVALAQDYDQPLDSTPTDSTPTDRTPTDRTPTTHDDRVPPKTGDKTTTSDKPKTSDRSLHRSSDSSDHDRDRGGRSRDHFDRGGGFGVDVPVTAVIPLLQWAVAGAHSRQQPPAAAPGPFVPGQVVIDVASTTAPESVAALERRHGLLEVDRFTSSLSGRLVLLERLAPQDSVASEVAALGAEPGVLAAQPNYVFSLQATPAAPASDASLQYAVAKMRLDEAHRVATGDKVLVGVIDSEVDERHPELRGVIAKSFDAVGGPQTPHAHGTAIAGLIAGHGRLTGSAPAARLLLARAFTGDGGGAAGSGYYVVKAVDWAAANGARVINMSFAGPSDPELHRALEAAWRSGVVLVAAAGNAGPNSPPLFPGAEPHVIAVTATDSGDHIYAGSNRGRYIETAAPGVDLLVAAPGGAYQLSSGTSLSAAEVSGVVALMLQRRPGMRPDAVRAVVMSAGKPLAGDGGFKPRLVDAYRAVTAG